MFELSPEIKPSMGQPENKPAVTVASCTATDIAAKVTLSLSSEELDALADLVLNAPPTKLVDEPMAEHLLRLLMQLQREKLFSSPE
ncbi:MAG: hypothetical protein ACKO14_06670 [Armatimonadota bacterium]